MAGLEKIVGSAVVDSKGKIVKSGYKDHIYTPEAVYFSRLVKDYLKGRGKSLMEYLAYSKGKKINIKGYGSRDLGKGVYGALIYGGDEGIIVGNGRGAGFDQHMLEFSVAYGISADMAKEYVIAHELVHASGNHTEYSTEMALYKHFNYKAKDAKGAEKARYEKLAKVAYVRAQAQKKSSKK